MFELVAAPICKLKIIKYNAYVSPQANAEELS
jgi:hypothetical protein